MRPRFPSGRRNRTVTLSVEDPASKSMPLVPPDRVVITIGDLKITAAQFEQMANALPVDCAPDFAIGQTGRQSPWTPYPNQNFPGLIDEVRISNTVLTPNQFLFVPIPEPRSVGLVLLGLIGLVGRRANRRELGSSTTAASGTSGTVVTAPH